jgi:2-C-methyl-D-erythritol 4-phosphate cytidylyltransferase
MSCGAVIPAAGEGRRFGEDDKLFAQVAGQSVLSWTLQALIRSGSLSEIVVVVSDANVRSVRGLINELQSPIPVSTTPGGALRMESVRAGVEALDEKACLVLIHDAARPALSVDLIRRTITAAQAHGAAIPVLPVTDTIKVVASSMVERTLDRNRLAAVQTPQVFRRDWLMDAYQKQGSGVEATDEASILERAGYQVAIVPGDDNNLKVTTQRDARVVDLFLREQEVD